MFPFHLKQFTAVVLTLLFMGYSTKAMASGPFPQETNSLEGTGRYSTIVATIATEKTQLVLDKIAKKQPLSVSDTQGAADALDMMNQYFVDIDGFKDLDHNLQAHGKEFIDSFILSDVDRMRSDVLRTTHVRVTNVQYEKLLRTTSEERQAAIDEIVKNGSKSLFFHVARTFKHLNDAVNVAANKERTALPAQGHVLTTAYRALPQQAESGDNPCTHMAVIAAGFGLVCAVSLGTAIPMCIAAAVATGDAAICQEFWDHSTTHASLDDDELNTLYGEIAADVDDGVDPDFAGETLEQELTDTGFGEVSGE